MPSKIVLDLKFTVREGGYVRGQEGYEVILRAALELLIEHGYRALSFRRIAEASGLKPGHISYYFPTKEDLVRELFEAVFNSYEEEFTNIMHEPGAPPERQLESLIFLILEDITTKKTTNFFIELWALSNHDQFVYDLIYDFYGRARRPLNDLIAQINPELSETDREALALFISASMEGMTVFAGHGKPHCDAMPTLARIAVQSFVQLVREMKAGDTPENVTLVAIRG